MAIKTVLLCALMLIFGFVGCHSEFANIHTQNDTKRNNSAGNPEKQDEQESFETVSPGWIKALGATVVIKKRDHAELKIFLVLEDQWVTFDFTPSAETSSVIKLNLPECFQLKGELTMDSKPTGQMNFFGDDRQVNTYAGLIEMTQKLSVDPKHTDFKDVVVGGSVHCALHDPKTKNSVPLNFPFVAFCHSAIPGIEDSKLRMPKSIEYEKDKK